MYSFLYILAQKLIANQATSVTSEGVFSRGSHIMSDLRFLLSNEPVANQLIFLSINRHLVHKPNS